LGISSETAGAADQHSLTTEKVEAWLEGYKMAWETLDPDKAAELFTSDATYQEDPYSDPFLGQKGIHEYWTRVTSNQRNVDFSFEVLAVSGNTGIAHWHSEFKTVEPETSIILDGIFVLEFSSDRLCQSLKEWWHFKQ